ncbi:uncharacterized protein LOC117117953 [Anneissia japonica]|uniref:uncharacterized protein LOC117117953 n=1 Tax=Anneissia japonica TaxID=1529436 RepID=UPI0014255622|nr:uncharacterized protein LOC117117953 [Anneissia japonica]
MATSLIQPFVDQENPLANTTSKKSSSVSSSKPIAGKTFSSASTPMLTPRQALGNISNDPVRRALGNVTNTMKRPSLSSTVKKGLVDKNIQLKKSTMTPGTQSSRKLKTKAVDASKSAKKDSLHPIETMHIYEDRLTDCEVTLPVEDCLSNLDCLFTSRTPLLHYPVRDVDDIIPDFSHLTITPVQRPESEPIEFHPGSRSQLSDQLLNLPPVDEVDFLNINSILMNL